MEALRVGDCCGHHPFTLLTALNSRLLRQGASQRSRSRRLKNVRSLSIDRAPLVSRGRRLSDRAAALTTTADLECNRRVELGFVVGSEVIPHPEKVEKGGEDAYFVSSYNGGVLGIADGVSGWAEENVDPALFSRELMSHAAAAVGNEEVRNCPQQLLEKAHEATSAVGAATTIVALLEREGILHIASVGDCGLRLIRRGKVVFATSTQQHYFDCPYQLSSESAGQTSADAMVYKLQVVEGDTIVMGSDGLFDNVYDREIETVVSLFGGSDEECAQRTATAIAALASKHAKDVKYESPYSQEAILQGYDLPIWKKLLGKKLTGGKLDDITVIIGHVVDAETLPRDEAYTLSKDEDLSVYKEERSGLESSAQKLITPLTEAK